MSSGISAFERVASEFETADIDWIRGKPGELRQVYNNDRRKLLGDVASDCRIEPIELETASGLVFTPPTPMHDRAVVYFHGGGWVVGSPATHQVPCSHLALRSRHAVWSMRYRLAPENLFPAQREDAVSAIEAVLERFDRVILAGDSAGAAVAFWGLHDLPAQLAARVDGIVGIYGCYGAIPPGSDTPGSLSPNEVRAFYARLGPLESLAAMPGFDIARALRAPKVHRSISPPATATRSAVPGTGRTFARGRPRSNSISHPNSATVSPHFIGLPKPDEPLSPSPTGSATANAFRTKRCRHRSSTTPRPEGSPTCLRKTRCQGTRSRYPTRDTRKQNPPWPKVPLTRMRHDTAMETV
ncbi:MAG: alpha/beta hydrolase fold domain-containing protein [Geminicoccaceae bacterium]